MESFPSISLITFFKIKQNKLNYLITVTSVLQLFSLSFYCFLEQWKMLGNNFLRLSNRRQIIGRVYGAHLLLLAVTDVKIRWAVWSRGWMGDERQTVKVPDWEREGKCGSVEWDICCLLWWGLTVLGQSSPSRFYPACDSGGSQDVEKIGQLIEIMIWCTSVTGVSFGPCH